MGYYDTRRDAYILKLRYLLNRILKNKCIITTNKKFSEYKDEYYYITLCG